MDYCTYSEKLTYLEWLIRQKHAGSSYELASRLEVSRSTVKRMVNQLRNRGMDVSYCKQRGSYIIFE